MRPDLETMLEHEYDDECPVCRTQDVVEWALIPAASAWEVANGLPRFAIALHGAAGLLGALLREGMPRKELDTALSGLLDEMEQHIAEEGAIGGPPQGNA